MGFEVREPIQKRSIAKKEKIIKAGFELICENGYHNTDTSKIAKKAGVSTGIIYQYFKDKRDILMAGLERYGNTIFYPIIDIPKINLGKKDLAKVIKNMIDKYIENHKLSQIAHEEIMAMTHSDKDVAYYFYKREIEMTNNLSIALQKSGFKKDDLSERVHIIIGLIDNLCHEIVYHKHKELNYDKMADIVVKSITNILE